MYDVAPEHIAGLVALALTPPLVWFFLKLIKLAERLGVQWAARFMNSYRLASPMTRAAAVLMLVTGAVHLALVGSHLPDEGITALLFVVNGAGFLVLGVAACTTTWWRRFAALWLVATILAYVVWLVTGWETPDQVGVATKVVELVALGLVMRLNPWRRFTLPRRIWRAVAFPLLTTVAATGIWIGGLAHPDASHSHVGAVTQPAPAGATPAQRAAATQLLADTRASISRFQDPAAAMAAGFTPGPLSDADPLLHFANKANDAAVLDPSHPQDLVYIRTAHGLRLVGAMFQMPRLGQWGPDPGGPLTVWHQHEGICFTPFGFAFSLASPFWTCPVGAISVTTPPMLHVWIIDNPKGPFSADLDPGVQRRLQSE